MRKLCALGTIVLLAACLSGCNRAWPGCFGRGLWYGMPAYESCDPCCTEEAGTYSVEPGVELVPPATTTVEPLEPLPSSKTTTSSKE